MIAIPAVFLGRRAALTVLGVVAFAIVCFGVIPVVATYIEQQDEIADGLGQIAGYRAIIATQAQTEADIKTIREQEKLVNGSLLSGTLDQANSEIQSEVNAIVAANSGQVRSAGLTPPEIDHGLDVVAIRYELSVPVTHLRDLIYAIETNVPYLFIDQVEIIPPANWQPGNPNAAPPLLDVKWTVRGYRWASTK